MISIDYNNFSTDSTITGVDRFHIGAVVYYVNQDPPYAKSATPTWLKQMDITVNNTISRSAFSKIQMKHLTKGQIQLRCHTFSVFTKRIIYGSTSLLDIIGSIITFGLLLLTALRLNASASEHSMNYQANYILQRNMVVLTTCWNRISGMLELAQMLP